LHESVPVTQREESQRERKEGAVIVGQGGGL
jgi:hypothetical protein